MKKNKNNIPYLAYTLNLKQRLFMVYVVFLLAAVLIIIKIFSYTVSDYEFYKGIADTQQIGEVQIPVTRGSIRANNRGTPLFATSVNLNDLAIDPTSIGDVNKLLLFLKDIVFEESCIGTTAEECKTNILHFTKKIQIDNFTFTKGFIQDLITQRLLERISQKKVLSVLLVQDLDLDLTSQISEFNLKGVYVNGGNVYVNPEEIVDREHISQVLSPIISFPEESIQYLIRKRKVKYIHILSRLSIDQSDKIQTFLRNEKEALKNNFVEKKDSISRFILLSPNPHRFYPENEIGSQVLGFVDNQGKGHYGIEGYFGDILKGEVGERTSRKDINGRIIEPIDFSKTNINRAGAIIYSTIDRNIQRSVEEILERGVKTYNANKGSIIVMNPQTGEVLSMANYPKFNPNKPGDVYEIEKIQYKNYTNPANELIGKGVFIEDEISGKEYYFDSKKILLREARRQELGDYRLKKYKYKNDFGPEVYKNTIITDIYEPGSIMKAITVAIGIDSGEITRQSFYQNSGPVIIDSFKISDISKHCKGYHSFAHALNYSCNVGMVRIIQKVGKSLLYSYLHDFGFGKSTGITLDGEVSLPISPYQKWSRAQLFSTSYGLGINVNQLQMAVAYSALANGGFVLRPQIIKKISFSNGKEINFKKEVIQRTISEKTSNIMIDLLVDSIDNGVASKGAVEGYSLAGKTGTSQIAYKGGYESGDDPGSTNASFAGFGPAQKPQFVIIVKLNRPRTDNYGGNTSSYLFSEVSEYLLNYYKIPKLGVK